MTQTPRNRISDLYHAALERTAEERHAFLREACGGDNALREEVESLLACEAGAPLFLEQPAAVIAGVARGGREMLNRQIGPYTIVAPLGSGGMGEVYRARDTNWGATWRSKSCPRRSPPIPNAGVASLARRGCSQP